MGIREDRRRVVLSTIRQWHWLGKTSREVATHLGIGIDWVNVCRCKLDLPPFDRPPGRNTRKDAWSEAEDAMLKEAIETGMSKNAVAARTGRTVNAVHNRRLHLDLPPFKCRSLPKRPRPVWTDSRIDELRALRQKPLSYSDCARVLGTTRGAVARVVHLYLKESADA
jgi:hypothetical protein